MFWRRGAGRRRGDPLWIEVYSYGTDKTGGVQDGNMLAGVGVGCISDALMKFGLIMVNRIDSIHELCGKGKRKCENANMSNSCRYLPQVQASY